MRLWLPLLGAFACTPEPVSPTDMEVVALADPLLGDGPVEGTAIYKVPAMMEALTAYAEAHPDQVSVDEANSGDYVIVFHVATPVDWARPELDTLWIPVRLFPGTQSRTNAEQTTLLWRGDVRGVVDAFPDETISGWRIEMHARHTPYAFDTYGNPEWVRAAYIAADTHRVYALLEQVLPGPWTGVAEGVEGGLALTHAMLFPDDVFGLYLTDPELYLHRGDGRALGFAATGNPTVLAELDAELDNLLTHRELALDAAEEAYPWHTREALSEHLDRTASTALWQASRSLGYLWPTIGYAPSHEPADLLESWDRWIHEPALSRSFDHTTLQEIAHAALFGRDLGGPELPLGSAIMHLDATADAWQMPTTLYEVPEHNPALLLALNAWLDHDARNVHMLYNAHRHGIQLAPATAPGVAVYPMDAKNGATNGIFMSADQANDIEVALGWREAP